jgi:hypothetical protein
MNFILWFLAGIVVGLIAGLLIGKKNPTVADSIDAAGGAIKDSMTPKQKD